MKKIFENIEGNKFKLSETESYDDSLGMSRDSDRVEEKREVQIGKEILQALDNMNVASTSGGLAADIRKLATELIQMHSSH